MQRCLGSLGGGPQLILQAIPLQRLRIDQSGMRMLAREAQGTVRHTYEDEDSVGICFPTVGHLLIFILCYLQILVEERFGSIT
jgi:hypothetical protein